MAHQYRYIIVGGGLAGASAVEGIRAHDRSGSIALFGKEQHLPYDRPPLSKGLWLGKTTLAELPVHDEAFYKSRNVHLYLGNEVASLDPKKKEVTDGEGARFLYDRLLIATGGTPRVLSFGADAVTYFRTVDDYAFLSDAAGHFSDFLFIGGGFIGSELAAALRMKGKGVTMVFPEQHLLQKVLPADLAAFVTGYYREKGVEVVNGDVPTGVERANGKSTVAMRSGKKFVADVVVAAIGLNLHTEMARKAGLKVENGISVNTFLQTSDPFVYAAGDIAFFPSPVLGKSIRIEHWNNAQAQGKHAGENMAGADMPFTYLPYFYSDLFDFGFEAVGDLDSRLHTVADWKEEFREGVVYYLEHDKLRGVLLWNVWGKVDDARELINKKKAYLKPAQVKGLL